MRKTAEIRRGKQRNNKLESCFFELLKHYPDGLFLIDCNGCFVEVNDGIEKLGGYSKTELLQTHFLSYIYKEDVSFVERIFNETIEGQFQETEFRIVTKSKKVKHVRVSAAAAPTNSGFSGVYGVAKDITIQKELEEFYRKGELRFESLIENSSDVIGILDQNGKVKYQSKAVRQVLGFSPEELIDTSYQKHIYPDDKELVETVFTNVLNSPKETVTTEIRIIDRYGEVKNCEVHLKNLLVDPAVEGIIVNYRDVTIRKKYEKGIKRLAFQDYLTGLPNRNYLENVFKQIEKDLKTSAFLFIDLDRFKVINDSLGQSTGNQLLQRVTERLQLSIEEGAYLIRQGGDEFIIFLQYGDHNKAVQIADDIIKNLSAPFIINEYELYTTPSIGISMYPENGKTIEELLQHADFAMYQAKKSGRNTYQFYSSSNQTSTKNPLKLEMDLHKALERDEFVLFYQPKFNLNNGRVIGVEALIRWKHPKLGLVSPADFIPIAEASGLIVPIGNWAIQTACLQNKKWQAEGLPPMVMSVNLSMLQFSQPSLIETVREALNETGLQPDYLEFEITESMTANISHTMKMLNQLKELGVRISIDDFGTGFSSLNYLKEFPVDCLKIDQSFVRELHNNASDQTIVKTIISMAHSLNLRVVAEGIETNEQRDFLKKHMCNEGQGYFFSKPLPAEEISEVFSRLDQLIETKGLVPVDELFEKTEISKGSGKLNKSTLHRQLWTTLRYKKVRDCFIHTQCEGELLYHFGICPHDVVGYENCDFLSKDLAEKVDGYYEKAWSGEEQVTFEINLDGVYLAAVLKPIIRRGRVVEVSAVYTDITPIKKAERALMKSEEKYRLIAENVTDLICILDNKGTILYASPSYEKATGIQSELLENSGYINLIHPEDAGLFVASQQLLAETKESANCEFRIRHVNTKRWILVEACWTPILNESGHMEHCVLVARDVTEKRQAEELLWKYEKLLAAGELAAGVAHEIRNPITSIKGFVNLLEQGIYNKEYFKIMKEEFIYLDGIINQFLAFAKPQANVVAPVHPKAMLEQLVKDLHPKVEDKGITIRLEAKEDLPLIQCEQNQISQAVKHILVNSVEAMPDGGVILVKVHQEEKELVMIIMDEGIGICNERMEKLGEPYYQNNEKGIGLGLMVCYRIIHEHKGSIAISSEQGKGTAVEVRLPIDVMKER